MIVVISSSGATLTDAQDTSTLHVAIHGGLDQIHIVEVLKQSGLGTLENGHAFLDQAGLRTLAGPMATPEWVKAVAAMADYAATKGWTNSEGALQAHLVYPAAS